jgi:cytochrome c-type biogenesis protein CcsB
MTEYSLWTSILCKISFSALASTMLYYWIRLSFTASLGSSVEFSQSSLFSPEGVGNLSHQDFKNNQAKEWGITEKRGETIFRLQFLDIGFFGILLSNISISLLLISRWVESGHFPFSNLFESLLFLCWTLTAIHLGLCFIETLKGLNTFLGVLLAPLALLINAFATFCLPKELQESTVLVPALQSNWLAMHVSVMILSYGFLLSGSLLALAYLIFNKILHFKNLKKIAVDLNLFSSTFNDRKVENISKMFSNSKDFGFNSSNVFLSRLDNGSYRCIGLGFAFLTLGILSGAVWANEAWGSYWSWDPKETWALVTWIVYALYLHVRLIIGWQGEKPAYVAIFGFLSVWLCYLGVNLLGVGLHSYGWFS